MLHILIPLITIDEVRHKAHGIKAYGKRRSYVDIGEDPAPSEKGAEGVVCMNSQIKIFQDYQEEDICKKRCQKDRFFQPLIIRIFLKDKRCGINKSYRQDHVYECIRSGIDEKENKASRKEKHPLIFLREFPINEQQNRREYKKFYRCDHHEIYFTKSFIQFNNKIIPEHCAPGSHIYTLRRIKA